MLWKHTPVLEVLNSFGSGTLVENLGILFTEIGDDYLVAQMPVDHRTKQPMGLLHGGASVALAETMGSVASTLVIDDPTKQSVVGLEINANHLRSAKKGFVYGTVKPIKVGRSVHVWEITILDEETKKVCISRLTVMILDIG